MINYNAESLSFCPCIEQTETYPNLRVQLGLRGKVKAQANILKVGVVANLAHM